MARRDRQQWYNSFYWRIGTSFVVFVFVVLFAQSLMFSYMMSGTNGRFSPGGANVLAAVIASDVGAALARDRSLDLSDYLTRAYASESPVFAVMKTGPVERNSAEDLPESLRRQADAMLRGTAPDPKEAAFEGPVVYAPIQVAGALQGMVVLPPPGRPPGLFGGAEPLLWVPGMLPLLAGTVLATIVIFGPARRRLHALEDAAVRFGAGEEQVRAPESGRDEIARVSRAFNRMADELTARTEALHAADRQRRQMLADVSHELRTPLTAVRGYLDTLHMSNVELDPATRTRYVATARHETNRLERIVMDLLDLARHEGGGIHLETRVFAVERLVESIVRRHERTAHARGIRLVVQVDPSADQIVADPFRIEQAVDNLVANALRHTPGGGTIELGAVVVEDACRLSVVDSGTGIAPEHLAHVFDRFYKVDPSRATGTSGSGLGLSIVKAIAERHGGTVTVESRPGRTEFVLIVPQSRGGDVRTETGR